MLCTDSDLLSAIWIDSAAGRGRVRSSEECSPSRRNACVRWAACARGASTLPDCRLGCLCIGGGPRPPGESAQLQRVLQLECALGGLPAGRSGAVELAEWAAYDDGRACRAAPCMGAVCARPIRCLSGRRNKRALF